MTTKNIISRIANTLGYEIIPQWRLENYELASHLHRLFEHLDIRSVLDVGANRGQYRDFLRNQVGYTGKIISFEPIESLARELDTRSASDENWHIFPFALGNENSTKIINVMSDTKFSSFLEPDNHLTSQFKRRNTVNHQQSVSLKKLDDIIQQLQHTYDLKNMYLKMDTQGYDLEVIKGAASTIQDISALQSEISFQSIYTGMPDFVTTISEYGRYGFEITGIFPVSNDESLKLIEADCVMINDRHT